MLKKNTIFDFMINVMVVFAISIISICICTFIFGKDAESVSTMFALGEKGIPLSTIMQYLAMACVITIFRWIFFTDILIKTLSITFRIILMYVMVTIMIAIFAAIFQWFPVDMVEPWIMFLICFTFFTIIGVVITGLKEKKENEKLQKALEVLKKEEM